MPHIDWPPAIETVQPVGSLFENLQVVLSVARGGRVAHLKTTEAEPEDISENIGRLASIFTPVALPADKDIDEITRIQESGVIQSATNWHFDQSFAFSVPNWSILFCVEPGERSVPTVFCDCAALLSSLSDGLRATLSQQQAVHEAYYPQDNLMGASPVLASAQHSVVRKVDDLTEALFVSPATVDSLQGWSAADSDPILDYLFARMNWPEFTVSHTWARGDLLMWPNERYAHRALPLNTGPATRSLARISGFWSAQDLHHDGI